LTILLVLAGIISCKQTDKSNEQSRQSSLPKDFERVIPPVMLTTPVERADYLVMHYWDKFNFRDTMYCHVPQITEQAFADFINFFKFASYDKICQGVKKLLDNAAVDSTMYAYFCTKAEFYLYNPNSPSRDDEYYIPFLEHMTQSPVLNEDFKIRPKLILDVAYRNRVGAKANDFEYTLASGQKGRMSDVKADYLMLMFYNPDCRECQNTKNTLKDSPVFDAAIKSGKLKVLAVYPDENIESWKNHLKEFPAAWINSYDKTLKIKNEQIYDLKAIPTLILLDKDKKVILKDISAEEIFEYLKK
jgi:thioredoxin-related protein